MIRLHSCLAKVGRILPGFVMLVLGACATNHLRVETSHDPDVDFDQFQTFEFASPLSTDNRGQRTTISVQLIAATTRELQSRGLQPVTSGADLRVDFFAAQGNQFPNSGFSLATSHNHASLSTWRTYNMRRISASNITEGMIIVDVSDIRRGALVFEGMAETRVTEEVRDNFSEEISGAIADIFSELP